MEDEAEETSFSQIGSRIKKSQKVILVEFPGGVENENKLLACFGGRENLSRTFTDPSGRLELRFRPEDPFCKPTCGDKTQVSVLLLKIQQIQLGICKCGCKCKKHAKKTEEPKTEIRAEILSAIDTSYAFNNLCDFQYLPTKSSKDVVGKESENIAKPKEFVHHPILDKVHFNKLVDLKWLGEEAPLFLPPAAFSRMEQPQDYHYRKDTTGMNSKTAKTSAPLNIIGRTRQRRTLHAVFVNYEVEKVPDKPSEVAVNQLKVKFIENDERKRVAKSFEEQPVWTKSGLNCTIDVSMERLKFILPTVAYYFTSGPWRNQWVKFGYDPRTDPSAAKYQTLDYRVRLVGGAKLKVRAKRSCANYLLPYKSMNWSKPKTSTIVREAFDDENHGEKQRSAAPSSSQSERSRFIFESGMIPPHRQMFYQYKDILIDEAQKVFSSNLKKNVRRCEEKHGWYKPGADAKVREILTSHITRALTKKDNAKDEESMVDYNEDDNDEDEANEEANEDMGEIVDEAMELEEDCEDLELA